MADHEVGLAPPSVECGVLFQGVPVGVVGYTVMDSGALNVHWYIKEKYRGRGIAYNAAKMMLEALDGERTREPYEVMIRPGNKASLTIARKLGFQTYRTTPENVYMRRSRGGRSDD